MPDIMGRLSPGTIVVGELHNREAAQATFRETIVGAGRQVEFFDDGTCAMFHLRTPTSALIHSGDRK